MSDVASDKGSARAPGVWSRGALVVVEQRAQMPDRCIRCNAVAGGRRTRVNFFWIDRSSRERARLWLLVPYAGALLRAVHWDRQGTRRAVEVGLCARHRLLRALGPVLAVLGVVGMVAVPWWTFDARSPSPFPPLLGFAVLAIGVLGAAWARRTARAHHIDPSSVTLAGAGEAFVKSLPMDPRPGEMAAASMRLARAARRKGS